MAKQNADQNLPNKPLETGSYHARESVTAPWWGKIFPFSWIGSWWSGKGAKEVPEDNAGQVETKNEERESGEVQEASAVSQTSAYNPVQAPKQAQTAGYSGLFHNIINIFSFGRWGSSAKSDGQGDGASGKELSVDQTPKTFTEQDLRSAISNHDYTKVQDIIKANPDWVHKQCHPSIKGFTFLDEAIFLYSDKPNKKEASLQIVKFLVDKMKKDSNPNAHAKRDHLKWAVNCNKIEIVKFFVEECSATISSAYLVEATSKRSKQIMQFLLEQQIEQKELDDALRKVVSKNTQGDEYEMYNEAVQDLITRGADVNSQDKDGNIALHISIYYNKFSTIEVLLKNRAGLSIKNTQDKTPIDLMNEKLTSLENNLSSAESMKLEFLNKYPEADTRYFDKHIEDYKLHYKKVEELIKSLNQLSGVKEGSGDDVLVHHPDGVGDQNPVLVNKPFLGFGAGDGGNVEIFPALYPEYGVFGDLNGSNLSGNLPPLLTNSSGE